ncbi:glycosyltransferase family 4 protein [Marinivivus vitaminiproducens]|uniref:glycosyltransferase family 4 protein n=1 Tax=Marinivivus vitaminiproducens TaxID=3035935 RepID=UPI00279A8553|nr:glycosyltransferase family 4 protein [Geminicoccaceae bacterium SCSIO 64248]
MRSEPMRIVLVTPGGLEQRGGIGSAMTALVEELDRIGVRWTLLDPWAAADPVRQLAATAVALARLARLGLAGDVDLVHVNMCGGGSVWRKGLFVLLAKALGLRVLVHLHAADLDTSWARLPRLLRNVPGFILRRADAVVALGAYWRSFLIETLRVPAARVQVIPNGVADPGGTARTRRNGQRIVFVGRLGLRKGTDGLLHALATPGLRRRPWTLTLAGDGDIGGMQALARRLGIDRRLAFLGWLAGQDVARMMRTADILVLPSRQEGLPMAVLEAMAHGLAIVTTRAGAIGDAVTDGVNGLLVEPGDPAALADALERVLGDAPLRGRLQDAARARFEADYAASRMAASFLALYRDLTHAKAGRGVPSAGADVAPRRRLGQPSGG